MNINLDWITIITIISNISTALLCIITVISTCIIKKQLQTANIYNFLEIESKVIQIKNELDLLEKNEKITTSNNTYILMQMMSKGFVNDADIFVSMCNEDTKKEINEKYEEKLKNNYYCTLDTMANILIKKKLKPFQNKHRGTIIEIYNKIKDTDDVEQNYPNIIKFWKKNKRFIQTKENKQ